MALTAEQKRLNRIDQYHHKFKQVGIEKVFNESKIGLASVFQKLVRISNANKHGMVQCVTCSNVGHWKFMDGGHYISRKNKATIIDPRNVWPQCKFCNNYGNGMRVEFRQFLLGKIGESEVLDLESTTLPLKHVWNRYELAVIKFDLLAEIKSHEVRLANTF